LVIPCLKERRESRISAGDTPCVQAVLSRNTSDSRAERRIVEVARRCVFDRFRGSGVRFKLPYRESDGATQSLRKHQPALSSVNVAKSYCVSGKQILDTIKHEKSPLEIEGCEPAESVAHHRRETRLGSHAGMVKHQRRTMHGAAQHPAGADRRLLSWLGAKAPRAFRSLVSGCIVGLRAACCSA